MNFLDRLKNDVVLVAEGYVFELERRDYLKAGPFVPEVVLENSAAGNLFFYYSINPILSGRSIRAG